MMLLATEIVALKDLGVYRDGGSISASFLGADDIEYCLFFAVRHPLPADRELRFRDAVLQWFCPYVYRSPITGDVSPMWRTDSQRIDWGEAQYILRALEPFFADFVSEYRWVYGEMVRAAARANSGGTAGRSR